MKTLSTQRVIVAVVVFLVAAQFVRPSKTNPPINPSLEITANLKVDPAVEAIFKRSCNDCHSNRTVWPWYSNVAPASWLVIHDVNDGRSEMNLSAWGSYNATQKQRIFDRLCREVSRGGMPPFQYTMIHTSAPLSDSEKQAVCDWVKTVSPQAGTPSAAYR